MPYLETMRGLGQAPMQTMDLRCDPNVSYPEDHACGGAERFWEVEQLARWGLLFPAGQAPETPALRRPPTDKPPFDLMAWLKVNQTPVLVGSAVLLGASLLTGGRRR